MAAAKRKKSKGPSRSVSTAVPTVEKKSIESLSTKDQDASIEEESLDVSMEVLSEDEAPTSSYDLSHSDLVSEEIDELSISTNSGGGARGARKRKRRGSGAKVGKKGKASSVGSDDFGDALSSLLEEDATSRDFPHICKINGGEIKVPTRVMGNLMASYLILRAFSWQLKLSPFSCEAFLEAVMSHQPNSIVDEIHVCLLRALVVDEVRAERNERSLNLEYLDFMTWPSFAWEWLKSMGYMIKIVNDDDNDDANGDSSDHSDDSSDLDDKDIHQADDNNAKTEDQENSDGKIKQEDEQEDDNTIHASIRSLFTFPIVSGKKSRSSKSSRPEYHLLPLEIKASILKTMCDHLIDRPSVRAEIDRRETQGEIYAGMGGRGGAFPMMNEQEMASANAKAHELARLDANTEKCVLCGLGGVLMCCDECPGAYHMRCAGESGKIHDVKRWRCPECLCGGRGESAGLRLALAGITPKGNRIYMFNGILIAVEKAHYDHLDGVNTQEATEPVHVTLYFGEQAQEVLDTMILPKKQRLDPSSIDAVVSFTVWPEKEIPSGLHTYVNKYKSGWAAAAAALRSHIEDTRKRRSKDKMWIPHGTCSKVIVSELPVPMSVSRYEWTESPSRIGRNTIRCGRCHTCLRPGLKRACVSPIVHHKNRGAEFSKLGYISALLAKMEREFWPLADNHWASPDGGHHFRNKWISNVRDASSLEDLKNLLLEFERSLRQICFLPDWYKYYPAALLNNLADDSEKGEENVLIKEASTPLPDILADSRKRNDPYEIASDMSIGTFVRSHGEWTSNHYKKSNLAKCSKLGPPSFLIRRAILNGGRKPIPGLKYRQGSWKINSKRLNWISEVESCENTSDLALAMRKLDSALKWEAAVKPRFAVHTIYANASIHGKRTGDDGSFEYAVGASSEELQPSQNGNLEQTDNNVATLPDSVAWTPEEKIPLWMIKSYEESKRREAAKLAIKAMQTLPRNEKDAEPDDPVVQEKRRKEEAIASNSDGAICRICYNTNESHAKSNFIKCTVCGRDFHGYCVIMTNEEVQQADPEQWSCPGCVGSEKLIARLVKDPKAGQNLPGVDPKDEKPRENKKHPGRPPKPFFERADYKVAERKEILRRLSESEYADLFDIVDLEGESDEENSPKAVPPIMPYDTMDNANEENPTACPVCQYPDLGRPLIDCTGCSRQFHRECMGIISNDNKLWDLRTIKCAECSGKRVRPPSENTILAAIEAAQEPASGVSSIQDRVKSRSQRSRKAKEAHEAKEANKANWMEAADRVLTRIYRMQVAEPFRFPIPIEILTDYTNYVENPMDLETIRDELYSYESPLDVVKRMKLIVDNCITYNGKDSKVTGQVNHMFNSFSRLWKKERLPLSPEDEVSDELMAKVGQVNEPKSEDLPYNRIAHLMGGEPASDWQRKAGKVLGQLSRLECMEPFLRPVPKGFMNYYDVIKKPMDLGTIKSKMADGRYLDPSQVLLDIDLIWINCTTFNQPDAPIIEDCKKSKEEFERLWSNGKVIIPSAGGVAAKRDEPKRPDDWVEQARGVLYRLINFVPQASWFYDPVDESEAPGYRDVVKTPIDLQTISEKLQKGQYPAPGNLLADIDLITKNAEAYNGPDDEITEGARIVDASFKKYWKNAGLGASSVVFDSDLDWIPNAMAAIDSVLSHPSAEPFATPVSERSAPGYSKIVKRPMDFSTIKFNLEKGTYFSPGQVADDVVLIFQNCRAYNPPGDEIRAMGSEIESLFKKTWESMGLPVPRKWKKR